MPGARKSNPFELLENSTTTRSSSVAPTLITDEMQAGELIMFFSPSLPEAATAATPASLSNSTTALIACSFSEWRIAGILGIRQSPKAHVDGRDVARFRKVQNLFKTGNDVAI